MKPFIRKTPFFRATLALLTAALWSSSLPAQTVTQHYAIEVAGIHIGTLTQSRTTSPAAIVYEQISDVQFWFFGKIKIYYKVVSRHDPQQMLLRSDVDATSSRGNFHSDIVWDTDHYAINVEQYRYSRHATEASPIDFTINRMYFEEPVGRTRVFADYFGNYASITPTAKGRYRVRIDDREDEYFYEGGKLVKIVKKNSVKNFLVKRVG